MGAILDKSRYYNLDDVKAILAEGGQVTLLIRHSARFSIREDDPTFGADVHLTEHGEAIAREFGEKLKGFTDAAFGASAIFRCRRTAALIGEGMGLKPEVADVRLIGIHMPFYKDQLDVFNLYLREGAMNVILRYIATGTEIYHNPLVEASEEIRTWLEQPRPNRLNIFVTHDSVCSQYSAGIGGLREFSHDNWVAYLSGILTFRRPGGEWTSCWFVPEQATPQAFAQ